MPRGPVPFLPLLSFLQRSFAFSRPVLPSLSAGSSRPPACQYARLVLLWSVSLQSQDDLLLLLATCLKKLSVWSDNKQELVSDEDDDDGGDDIMVRKRTERRSPKE